MKFHIFLAHFSLYVHLATDMLVFLSPEREDEDAKLVRETRWRTVRHSHRNSLAFTNPKDSLDTTFLSFHFHLLFPAVLRPFALHFLFFPLIPAFSTSAATHSHPILFFTSTHHSFSPFSLVSLMRWQ